MVQTNSDMGWILCEYCHTYFTAGEDHDCSSYNGLILSGVPTTERTTEQRLIDIEKAIKKLQADMDKVLREVRSNKYRTIRRMGE